jgi:antitoxin (DNA-binding transcriptional repressor) of toxin-antitoxin stability system
MPMHTIGLEQGRNTFPSLAARAHAGEPSLLTRHGRPYAAIVPPEMVAKSRPRPNFLALRGSGEGLWGASPSAAIEDLRAEWS